MRSRSLTVAGAAQVLSVAGLTCFPFNPSAGRRNRHLKPLVSVQAHIAPALKLSAGILSKALPPVLNFSRPLGKPQNFAIVRVMLKDAIDLSTLRHVLVIKLRHHGDVLLTSPVFSVLKNHAPHLEIDALVYQDTAEMLSLHPAISQLHTIDRKWKSAGIFTQAKAEWKLLSALRTRRYDLIVHLTEHNRGAWLTRLLGARYGVAE
jgi:hypothetical protein